MPARLRKVEKAARKFGIEINKPKRGGSHWKARKDKMGSYPIPARNGRNSEIPDWCISGLCAHFEIDLSEFKRYL